ncbi:MAG: hypothetical protein ACOVQX_00625 [Legionella sp.]
MGSAPKILGPFFKHVLKDTGQMMLSTVVGLSIFSAGSKIYNSFGPESINNNKNDSDDSSSSLSNHKQ